MTLVSKEDIEALRKSGLFDEKWYLEQYPAVGALGMDPVEHYLWFGARLRRNPSPAFDTQSYLDLNPDVTLAMINPLLHYTKWGKQEGRTYLKPASLAANNDTLQWCKRLISRRVTVWNMKRENALVSRISKKRDRNGVLLSVIMPTFNRASCIAKSITSVVEQSYQNWELLIVDDGSEDNTKQIVDSFGDERILYVRHPARKGVSAARNSGLQKVRGDWVFFLDSDNEWRKEYLQTMVDFVSFHGIRAAYCATRLVNDRGEKSILFAEFDFESCLQQNYIDLNSFCVDRELSRVYFDESIRRLVDWDYILRIAARTRMLGAYFLGVEYYDGDRLGRITRSEYRTPNALKELMDNIRDKANKELTLSKSGGQSARVRDIAVVFHVFHKDIVGSCLAYLKNIEGQYDLFVTTSYDENDEVIAGIRAQFPEMILVRYPNIGGDIAPFMELVSTLSNYDLVCKIHTKRNVDPWGGSWREHMLQSILGSAATVSAIIHEFSKDETLLAIGPKQFFKSGKKNTIPETRQYLMQLAEPIDLSSHLSQGWGFFAGSMFWARPGLFLKLARYLCDVPSYSGSYKSDGLMEHAIERALGLVLLKHEHSVVGLSTPSGGSQTEITKVSPRVGYNDEAVTVTLEKLWRVSIGERYLCFFPDYTVTNSYQRLLYHSFKNFKVACGSIDECKRLCRSGEYVVFHLHWLNALLGSAKTRADADKLVDEFLAKLLEFKQLGGHIGWTVHNVISHEPTYLEHEIKLSVAVSQLADWIHVHHLSVLDAAKPYYELPAEKVVVAHHGNYIGTLPVSIDRNQAREKLGLPSNATVFAFLGQVRAYKGIDELIDAFARVSAEDGNCWLVIAGKVLGMNADKLQQRCAGMSRVLFRAGHVPDDQMQFYLRAADAMVLPYRKVLTSGSVYLAMSFGLPVICPRAGLLSYLVQDGNNGFVYDGDNVAGLANSMRRFLRANPKHLADMGNQALRTAQTHRWDDTSAKLRRHIEGLDFGRRRWTNISGLRRAWFVRGDVDALGQKRCIAIVLHYQNVNDTRSCVASILSQAGDIGVVLLSNSEAMEDIVGLSLQFPDVVCVQSEENTGFAAANNFGLQICRDVGSEFFWIVNPDMIVPDGYYVDMLHRVSAWSSHEFFGSTIVSAHQPDKVLFCGGKVHLDQGAKPEHAHIGAHVSSLPREPFECDYLTGANIFGRTKALSKIGYMPEEYFLYFEETDWFLSYVLCRSGGRPLVFPDLIMRNFKRSEGNGLVPSRYYIYYFIRNSLLFGKKLAPDHLQRSEDEARKFAQAWLTKIRRGAPERDDEFQELVELAFKDGRAGQTGRVFLG